VSTTRYYLSSDSALTPAVTIPVATAWQFSSGFARTLSATPTNSLTATSLTSESLAGATQVMSRQFSVAIPSDSAPTVVRGSIGAREASATTDAYMRVIVRLVASDGTHKANLADVQHATETSNSTSFLTRSFTASLAGASVASGDLLVVELGHNVTSTASTTQTGVYIGGDSTTTGAADAAFADDVLIHNQTPPVRQWLEVDWSTAAVPVDVTLAGQVQSATASVAVDTVADIAVAGEVAPVVADVQVGTLVDVTLAGQVGSVTAALAVEAVPDEVSVALDGQVSPATADFAVDALVDAALAGQVAPVTAAVTIDAGETAATPLGTDTTNGAHFRHRGGWAVAEWEPAPTPLPLPATAHSVMVASAFGPVAMQGTQPTFTTSQDYATRLRQRILIGGVDMTVHRGVLAPDVDFQLADPLLYGPATVTLPSISAVFEQGAHPNLAKGKRVKVQLVDDNNVVQHTLYKGFVLGPGVGGRNLTLDVGGEAQGRASQMDKQPPIFRDVLDLSRIAWRAIADMGLRYLPRLGEPGIGIRSLNFGGTGMLEHIEEIIARATKKDGTQRTILPDADGVYRLVDKDTTTVHYTLFVDDAHVVPDLRSDMSEEPNRIYATTVTPAGMRVRFGAYPGLIQGPAPDYPMADDSYFGVGTTDEDTDTGDGISVMINRLGAVGLLDIRDTPGGFDDDVADAVNKLGRKAGATAPVGSMTPGLWSALWDLDVTGYDRKWSSIQPAAELDEVRRFDRSSSGAVIGLNDEFDPDAIKVDRSVDMGSGFTRKQAADFSETLLSDGDEWFGTITVNTWAVLAGQVDVGATITAADLVDARLVKPGQNIWLPNFAGGILVHVSGVDVSGDRVAYTVDTRARPAREVWERIQVRRETRRDPSRRWLGNRQSTRIKDAVQGFDEFGGVIDRDIPLEAGHNVLEIVAGDYGTIRAIRTLVQTVTRDGGSISVDPHEHAVYVFGKEPSAERLNALIGNPLTEAGERAIRRSAKAYLDSRRLLYSAGTQDEPCGYGRDLKSDGATLTGEHIDDSGFSYVADNGCTLFLVVYEGEATTLRKGRAMWPQLEGGV
jgi:hypothetical protein